MSDYEIHDDRFDKLIIGHAKLERLWTGSRWAEGPVYVPAARQVLWSDIPNNRVLRFVEDDSSVSVLETPCGFQNGHALDGEGRVIACEHGGRRISRLDHDGVWRALITHFEGKRLNSPNDVVVKSDGTIWFSDPTYGIDGYYEGALAESEIGAADVYRLDPASGEVTAVARDRVRPNGLAFSPDETILYVADTGETHVKDTQRAIHAYAVGAEGKTLAYANTFAVCDKGFFDGFRVRLAWQSVDLQRRFRAGLRAGRKPDRPDSHSRARLQPLLRRPASEPALHHRTDVALRHLSQYARGELEAGLTSRPAHSDARVASGKTGPLVRSFLRRRPRTRGCETRRACRAVGRYACRSSGAGPATDSPDRARGEGRHSRRGSTRTLAWVLRPRPQVRPLAPSAFRRGDRVAKMLGEQQALQRRVALVGVHDAVEHAGADDAAGGPDRGDLAQIEAPAILRAGDRHLLEALLVGDDLGRGERREARRSRDSILQEMLLRCGGTVLRYLVDDVEDSPVEELAKAFGDFPALDANGERQRLSDRSRGRGRWFREPSDSGGSRLPPRLPAGPRREGLWGTAARVGGASGSRRRRTRLPGPGGSRLRKKRDV